MSKIKKNGALDQYGAEPFEQQQFGSAGVEGVNALEIVSRNGYSDNCSCTKTPSNSAIVTGTAHAL